eukprot:7381098-Prymnesium_polylepis.1
MADVRAAGFKCYTALRALPAPMGEKHMVRARAKSNPHPKARARPTLFDRTLAFRPTACCPNRDRRRAAVARRCTMPYVEPGQTAATARALVTARAALH